MNLFRTPLIGLCISIVLLLCSNRAQSQEQTYRGPLRIAKYEGEATYQYRIAEGDTLRNGTFRMQRSDLQSLLKREDSSFLFSGNYADNIPVGNWRLRFGSFTSGDSAEVVDYEYRVLVNGEEEEAQGNLSGGRPDGTWNIAVNRIENSEIAQVYFKSKFDFQNGIPQGSFQLENLNGVLVGRFLRDGQAHDQWTVFGGGDLEIEENWYFKEGVLERVETVNDGEKRQWQMDELPGTELKTLHLDKGYIQALRFQLMPKDSMQFLGGLLPELLEQNASYYRKINHIFKALGSDTFYPQWKVKLAHFPLDSLEKEHVQKIKKQLNGAKAISDRLLNNSQLNLLKLTDEEAAYRYAVLMAIQDKWLDPLEMLVDYERSGALDFIPRDQLMRYIWPNGIPTSSVNLSTYLEEKMERYEFSLPQSEKNALAKNDLEASALVSTYALERLQIVEKELQSKLGKHQGQQELLAVEEHLIVLNDSLIGFIDSVENKFSTSYKKAFKSIRVFAEKELADYAASNETPEKINAANDLEKCFEELNKLSRVLANLPQERDSIKKQYVDGVWNPFMAVVMEEEVKKRITSAYDKVLIPYFLKRVEDSLSCEIAAEVSEQITQTNKRMFVLRERETKKLERKLRREKDPNTVLELFNSVNAEAKEE